MNELNKLVTIRESERKSGVLIYTGEVNSSTNATRNEGRLKDVTGKNVHTYKP